MKRKVVKIASLGRLKSQKVGVWPEVVVSTLATRLQIQEAGRQGKLRRIGSRIYTSNRFDEPSAIIRRHLIEIISSFFPNSVITERSAASPGYVVDGVVSLVHGGASRDIDLPGVRLSARKGIGPLSEDVELGNSGVYLASQARVLVENLVSSRRRFSYRRRLSTGEVEEYLDRLYRVSGARHLKWLADQVPMVAKQLELESEGREALDIIRTFLGSKTISPSSKVLRARLGGAPYDSDRLSLCQILLAALQERVASPYPVDTTKQPEFPFFEAYFSNYIEGTKFEISEARSIIKSGIVPKPRPADGHDILFTYQLVADPREMRVIAKSGSEFLELLRARHAILMKGRPEKNPGQFKTTNNQAGGTVFVSHDLVVGTLKEAFAMISGLVDPLARAIYTTFLISEVHPFDDGNGRLARIFLNAELFSAGEQRIIVPTFHRYDYLSGLRGLSNNRNPKGLIAVLSSLQSYSSRIDWGSYQKALSDLQQVKAFEDQREGAFSVVEGILRTEKDLEL